MSGYAIPDWDVLFETDDKGGAWREGKPYRRGPLNYLRLPCVGTFRRRLDMIRNAAGNDGPAIKGLFLDLLALVGGMDRDQREGGVIRGVDGQPAEPSEIADTIGADPDTLHRALAVLTDRRVGLLRVIQPGENTPTPGNYAESLGNPVVSPEIPGNPRNSGALHCITDHDMTKQDTPPAGKPPKEPYGEFVRLTAEEHGKLIEKYGAEKTADMIARLDAYVGSTGKRYRSHYHTLISWEQREQNGKSAKRHDRDYADRPSKIGSTICM
jgi:hypothetical protein